MFNVGDLVMCGDEAGVILRFWCQDGMNEGETEVMAECLWQNGDIEDVSVAACSVQSVVPDQISDDVVAVLLQMIVHLVG